MKLNRVKYTLFRAPSDVIDAIRRSSVKIDPMSVSGANYIYVVDWVPKMVQLWQDNAGYGGLSLEDFLRKMGGKFNGTENKGDTT
jgi:hypothetical protein